MISFRQKQFTEYDAMKSLYEAILRVTHGDRERKFPVIDKSALIPILKGNNVVVEKFTISTSLFGRDKYRMYIKIGAKAKLPDEVRLPGRVYTTTVGDLSFRIESSFKGFDKNADRNFSEVLGQREFGGKNNQPPPMVKAGMGFGPRNIQIEKETMKLLGEAIEYSKPQRSLVLEFDEIDDAIRALNILPFGLNYKIYLLDA